MDTISLTIPNMKSLHCQMTVTNAVSAIGGKVKSISPIKAEIQPGSEITKAQVIQAIQTGGYQVVN